MNLQPLLLIGGLLLVAEVIERHHRNERENPDFRTASDGHVYPLRTAEQYGTWNREASDYDYKLDREYRDRKRRKRAHRARQGRHAAERIADLETQRDELKAAIAEEPAHRYTALVGQHGQARSEEGLIPLGKARELLGSSAGKYARDRVQRNGHTYLRWEYAIDQKANDLGYADSQDFRNAIERVQRDRARLERINADIAQLRRAG